MSSMIESQILAFAEAFNRNSLDDVMSFFSEDAVYEPGDGKRHEGLAAVRKAFLPQFSGAFGKMRFVPEDAIVDLENNKAVFTWVCKHNLEEGVKPSALSRLRQVGLRAIFGNRFGWKGLDILHFDDRGKIKAKYTYGWYGAMPHMQRELG
ncbi:hypothetical protein HDN1F_36580 [gamma proteobacterium HdN1]|nr:hypothetical protein HDN1F_36580 [gamma proteobacterium HdN1]